MPVYHSAAVFLRHLFINRISAGAFLFVTGTVPNAWASSGSDGHNVIANIAICMVAAAGMGLAMRVLRQPLILGYLLAGITIGPIGLRLIHSHDAITTVAEIGLILLLFMIGLEIDLKKMLSSGRLVIVTGVVQFPISVGLAWLLFQGMAGFGWGPGDGYLALYAAMATAISSTMVVVKLLYEKKELDTLPGRVTVGILVFQDIWAIVVLALQPNFGDFRLDAVLTTFGAGVALVGLALVCSFYVLPRLFHLAAMIPELMLVLALGWCFLVAMVAVSPRVGLSMEMGALIAGVSLATFPYNIDVIAKVITIRDFFITLFFVALGMQIPTPNIQVLTIAALLVGWVLVARFLGVFLVQKFLRAGHRIGLVTAINLSQISEFSLVILALGVGFGHIPESAMPPVIWAFAIMAVLSTYLVGGSHAIQALLSRWLVRLGMKDVGSADESHTNPEERTIIILGFFREASALLWEIQQKHQHFLNEILVIDFNPRVRETLNRMDVPCIYGDIAHLDTIHHAAVENARLVLSTVPDALLKGTSNLKILKMAKTTCPHARVIVTASGPEHGQLLMDNGADLVLLPAELVGNKLVSVMEVFMYGNIEALREEIIGNLEQRKEILL